MLLIPEGQGCQSPQQLEQQQHYNREPEIIFSFSLRHCYVFVCSYLIWPQLRISLLIPADSQLAVPRAKRFISCFNQKYFKNLHLSKKLSIYGLQFNKKATMLYLITWYLISRLTEIERHLICVIFNSWNIQYAYHCSSYRICQVLLFKRAIICLICVTFTQLGYEYLI